GIKCRRGKGSTSNVAPLLAMWAIIVDMDLVDLQAGFRDDSQLWQARMVVHDRLADDRDQDECRYLLKVYAQPSASYRQVTWTELRDHLGASKLAAVEGLVASLADSPDAVDAWIRQTKATFPVIQDRGYVALQARIRRLRRRRWLRSIFQPWHRR